MAETRKTKDSTNSDNTTLSNEQAQKKPAKPVEHNGPKGLEPTRYGDWERNGRCTDF